MLRNENVEVFLSPQPSTSRICAAEWRTHQTCCNATHIVNYAKADVKQVGAAIKDIKADLYTVLESVTQVEEKLYEAVKGSSDRNAVKDLDKITQHVANFKQTLESLKQQEKTDNQEQTRCFSRIKQIRTNSLCYTCSGRSSRFFLQGQAMMSIQDCQTTISKCSDTWKDALDLFDAMRLARRIQRYIKEELGQAELVEFDNEHLEKLRDWIGGPETRRSFKKCFTNPASCAESSAKKICNKFISLRRDDLLQEIETVPSKSLSGEEPHSESTNRAVWAARSGRKLQFADNSISGRFTALALGSVLIVRTCQIPSNLVVPSYNNDQLEGDSP